MKTDTRDKILQILVKKGRVRPHELAIDLGMSSVAVHKQLKILKDQEKITRVGSAPLTYYVIKDSLCVEAVPDLADSDRQLLDQFYAYITPKGEIMDGVGGFVYWAREVNHTKDVGRLIKEYLKLRRHINDQKNNGWLDVTEKIRQTFKPVFLDQAVCLDFYSLPVFGKTKLGQQVLVGKQTQSKDMIDRIVKTARPLIEKMIIHYDLNIVAYIPPTIPRKLQFMTEFKERLNLNLPIINLVKIKVGEVIVAQKSLSKLGERMINARETIEVRKYPWLSSKPLRVLLIDDAIGSGASLQETAAKLKATTSASYVVGFGLVSSYKGYDVISEV